MKIFLQAHARGSGLGISIPVTVAYVHCCAKCDTRKARDHYEIRTMVRVQLPWGAEDDFQVRDLADDAGASVSLDELQAHYPVLPS